MDAPRCKICGQRHWGACANSPSARAVAGERGDTVLRALLKPKPVSHVDSFLGEKPVKAKPKPKPKGKAKKPKKSKKASYAGADRASARSVAARESFKREGSKRGRPLASEAHLSVEHNKPWEAAGMSRRTWYRRKAHA